MHATALFLAILTQQFVESGIIPLRNYMMDGCSSVTLLVWAHVPDQLLKICVHNAAFEECNLLHRTRYYHDVQLLQNAFDLLGNLNVLDLFLMMDD